MNKYGEAAINAVNLLRRNKYKNPIEAWEEATCDIFGSKTQAQLKSCPRSAFLAICETGKIKGIKAGAYTKSRKNKAYAITAFNLLQENPSLSKDKKQLWNLIPGCKMIQHNSQMDVVIALWENRL